MDGAGSSVDWKDFTQAFQALQKLSERHPEVPIDGRGHLDGIQGAVRGYIELLQGNDMSGKLKAAAQVVAAVSDHIGKTKLTPFSELVLTSLEKTLPDSAPRNAARALLKGRVPGYMNG